MRRPFVLLICLALAFAGCDQEDSAPNTDNPVTTSVAIEAASETDKVPTTEPGVVTTVAGSAAETAEAFNSTIATIVELSMLLSDEFAALKASIQEHRADLIKGDRGAACCGAHIDSISTLEWSIAEESWSAREFLPEVSQWIEEYTMPQGGVAGMADNFDNMENLLHDASSVWRGIVKALESGNLSDIDAALSGLDDCAERAAAIGESAEACCPVRLNN